MLSSLLDQSQLKGHRFYKVNPVNEKKGYNFSVGYDGNSSYVSGKVYTEKSKSLSNTSNGRMCTNSVS